MKARPNKLDRFAERLDEWAEAGKTLAEMREQLKLDGCSVALSSLSDFLARRRAAKQEALLLAGVASGSKVCKDVEAEFQKNPEPRLRTVIGLIKTLIMNVSAQSTLDPEMLYLVEKLMKPVMEYFKETGKQEDRALARQKFEFDAAKACQKKLPELKAIVANKSLSDTQQVEQIRLTLFGELPKEAGA